MDTDFDQLTKQKRYSYMGKRVFSSFLSVFLCIFCKHNLRRFHSTGYSVLEEKKVLSRDDYTVVTGSPRDKAKGSVTLGTKRDKMINATLTIPGEQVGSYFGSSLAVTDLNNDE